jgi:hypothetical protein
MDFRKPQARMSNKIKIPVHLIRESMGLWNYEYLGNIERKL